MKEKQEHNVLMREYDHPFANGRTDWNRIMDEWYSPEDVYGKIRKIDARFHMTKERMGVWLGLNLNYYGCLLYTSSLWQSGDRTGLSVCGLPLFG